MLIGLSRRFAFEVDGEPRDAFWLFLENLGLDKLNDARYDSRAEAFVDDCLHRVIWRLYEPNGFGGLFPLQAPEQDQTRVELWYQLNAYLLENE